MGVKAVRVGVIGCGFIAQSGHLPALLKCKNVEMVAVCDKNKELAENVASKFKIGHYYTDVAEMLQKERLNMVDICTATPSHAPLAIQAMEASCHVLTEKPIASNVAEADAMIQTAERMKVKLCVIQDMLFSLVVTKMRSIARQGLLGDILRIDIKQLRPKNDPQFLNKHHLMHTRPGGIIVGDDLAHPVYLAREFLGDLEVIAAYTRKVGSVKHVPFDEIQVILKGEKGQGSIVSSYNFLQGAMIIDIFGTEMNLHGELGNSILFKYKGPGSSMSARGLENLNRCLQIFSSTIYAGARAISGRHGGHRILIAKFIESILNDTEPPVTAAEGREIVRILERVIGLCEGQYIISQDYLADSGKTKLPQ